VALVRRKLSAISVGILLVVSLLAFYMIRQTLLADRVRKRIWEEREHLVEALTESERKLETLMGNLPGMAYRCLNDKNWTMEFCSDGCFDLTGCEASDLIGNRKCSFNDLIHPDDQGPVWDRVQEALAEKQPFKVVYRIQTAEGKEKWVWEQGVGVFSEDGDVLALEGFVTDITDRKLAEDALKKSHEELHKSLEETVKSLASTTEKRDPYTAGHQQRVDRLACAIARELGLPEEQIEGLHVAAILHDIGKISVPSAFLAKPTKLTSQEKEIIKCHTEVGCEILKSIPFPWPVAEIIRQHHELLDGSGYPRGLSKKEILLEAKILTVADVVEAMSSHRPYRPSLGLEMALEEIRSGKGTRYDPQIVDACLRLIIKKNFKLSDG
jgi:putative nucleotidyltransferase with HDIG domain/PAS domain S-box-containing protein